MRHALLVPFAISCAATPPPTVAAPASADTTAIQAVLAEFQRALLAHDAAGLDALWLAPEIPFRMRLVAKGEVVDAGTGATFAKAVGTAATTWEERFQDVTIVARDGLATLDSSYTFLDGGKASNHGREVWILVETPKGWRIASVTWSIAP